MGWMSLGGFLGDLVLGPASASADAAEEAARAQERAGLKFEARLEESAQSIEDYAGEFVQTLTDLDTNFDPLRMEEAFNSLYEAVIMPMERDFDENVLPTLRAAYSGGILGQGAALSGAANESEGRARRDMAETTAQLRFSERDKAIARNYSEWDRRVNLAQQTYQAQTAAPLLRAEQAPQILQTQQSTIATQLGAAQARANVVPATISMILGMASSAKSLAGGPTPG